MDDVMIKKAGVVAAVLAAFLYSANAQTFPGQAPVGAIPYWATTTQLAPSGMRFDSNGHLNVIAAAPPVMSGGCVGTGSNLSTGSTDVAGTMNARTDTGSVICTITFAAAYTNIPHCTATGWITQVFSMTTTTTTLTIGYANTALQKISYHCIGS